MSRSRIGWTVTVAVLIGVNLFLFVGTAMFALSLWAVCALSALGAGIGVLVNKTRDKPDSVIGALAGSAIAIFCYFGFIMSIFARLLKDIL